MITSQKPEDTPEDQKTHKWKRNPVAAGSSSRGWICGPPCGAYVHYINKQSKPCRAKMSKFVLTCPHCERDIPNEWRGYVPYYDDDYTRRFVMINKEYYESVSELEHLSAVVVTRGPNDTDPVVIKNKAWRTQPIPFAKDRAEPGDLITFCLLVLWKDDILIAWHNEQRRLAATAKPTTPQHTKREKAPTPKTTKEQIDQALLGTRGDQSLHDQYAHILGRVKPSENGHHTKTDDKAE